MSVVFYVLFGALGLLGAYFTLSSLVGTYQLGKLSQALAKLVLLVGAGVGAGVLYWAYLLGEIEGKYLAGTGAVLLAVVAFQAVQLVGMLVCSVMKHGDEPK